MSATLRSLRFATAATALLLTIAPARADAIDGSWCQPDGKHMRIEGPDIVTPMGTATKGNYDRHAFSYTVPAKDPGAGSTINMTLIDDDTLHSRVGAAPSYNPKESDVWHRCTLPTS